MRRGGHVHSDPAEFWTWFERNVLPSLILDTFGLAFACGSIQDRMVAVDGRPEATAPDIAEIKPTSAFFGES